MLLQLMGASLPRSNPPLPSYQSNFLSNATDYKVMIEIVTKISPWMNRLYSPRTSFHLIHQMAAADRRNTVLRSYRLNVTMSMSDIQHSSSSLSEQTLWLLRPRNGCQVLRLMSLSVCLSARDITRKSQGRTPPKILCILPVVVARSSSVGFAIRYVLPVLCMTSFSRSRMHRAS